MSSKDSAFRIFQVEFGPETHVMYLRRSIKRKRNLVITIRGERKAEKLEHSIMDSLLLCWYNVPEREEQMVGGRARQKIKKAKQG